MSHDDSLPMKVTRGQAEPPARRDFWEKYGWNTTISLCFGIGGFGLLQFLVALVMVPTHPIVDVVEVLVLLGFAPLLIIAGITGFLLPVHDLTRHFLLDE